MDMTLSSHSHYLLNGILIDIETDVKLAEIFLASLDSSRLPEVGV